MLTAGVSWAVVTNCLTITNWSLTTLAFSKIYLKGIGCLLFITVTFNQLV